MRVHQRTSRAVENKALIVESITSNHEGWWGGRGGYICAIVKRTKGSPPLIRKDEEGSLVFKLGQVVQKGSIRSGIDVFKEVGNGGMCKF